MLGSLGLPEILVIGFVVLLIFGPRQIPKLGRGLGDTIREFRNVGKELTGANDEVRKAGDEASAALKGAAREATGAFKS